MRAVIGVLLCVGAALASVPYSNRIAGGDDATNKEFPFMASLQSGNELFWLNLCGGSLLTNRAVLSSAHCFHWIPNTEIWSVVLGTDQATTGGVRYSISTINFHSGWDSNTFENDIVILHLSQTVTYTDKIQSARIAGPNYVLPDNMPVTYVGWGFDEHGERSTQLKKVVVNTVNQSVCTARYAELKAQAGFQNWPDVTEDMMCTGLLGEGGKDACQGDDGGPLLHGGDIVVGVTSWGYHCADPRYPHVVSRVHYNSEWIQANV